MVPFVQVKFCVSSMDAFKTLLLDVSSLNHVTTRVTSGVSLGWGWRERPH